MSILLAEVRSGLTPFPDTSNTRYHSYGDAACVLFIHLDDHLEFLKQVYHVKTKSGWTNMEKNVYQGLKDPPTLTELCCMALYHVIITIPYLRVVRTDAKNALDLAPFHAKVRAHIEKIAKKRDLPLDDDSAPDEACLVGTKWENQKFMETVWRLSSRLPFLKDALVQKFEGALTTFTRFTAEYALGGLIDSLADFD
jgi:hypothetical protein